MQEIGANGQVVYIEFNVSDIARSKRFYGEVFGWFLTDYGPTYTEFFGDLITRGFTSTEAVTPGGGSLMVFYAANLQETRNKLQAAGVAIVQPIFAFRAVSVSILGIWTAIFWACGRKIDLSVMGSGQAIGPHLHARYATPATVGSRRLASSALWCAG